MMDGVLVQLRVSFVVGSGADTHYTELDECVGTIGVEVPPRTGEYIMFRSEGKWISLEVELVEQVFDLDRGITYLQVDTREADGNTDVITESKVLVRKALERLAIHI